MCEYCNRTPESIVAETEARVRTQVAQEIADAIEAELQRREADACCDGNGRCGAGDCREEAGACNAFFAAAHVARQHAAGPTGTPKETQP